MDARRGEFELAEMCAVLDVSLSGYRAWTCGLQHLLGPPPP
jgi:hypothetical protein